ncbi:hypothetical protein BRADI_2g10985v3 [Brachypodium distachyon]|uniref:Uncharacterized protein n=1 Tax=Brachypodium distachyon TaxID=15368 RepID=A0A0Q3IDK1_BRADI|nr:hypothetical protein BRADI_2g10985v3 [Brachypodium distachyon]
MALSRSAYRFPSSPLARLLPLRLDSSPPRTSSAAGIRLLFQRRAAGDPPPLRWAASHTADEGLLLRGGPPPTPWPSASSPRRRPRPPSSTAAGSSSPAQSPASSIAASADLILNLHRGLAARLAPPVAAHIQPLLHCSLAGVHPAAVAVVRRVGLIEIDWILVEFRLNLLYLGDVC